MKFNKGEWSELFVIASIFNNNKIKIANSINHMKVIKIYFNNKRTRYLIYGSDIRKNNEETYPLYTNQKVKQFLNELKNSKGSSFVSCQGRDFILKYDIPKVKETKNKGDIDTNTIFPNEDEGRDVNFSIKSFIGSSPTLLNSSQATNFLFEIKNFSQDVSISEINAISTKSKIRDRIMEIKDHSTDLKIVSVEDSIFHENMLKIDTNFLEILAPILLNYYSTSFSSISDLVQNTKYEKFSIDIVKLKIKHFLRAFALGMIPKIPWNGNSVNGGSIVVKSTGDLLAYTLYDMDEFDEFLYENCKLDTPSSSRHRFGEIFSYNEKYYIKLNLQIRFK